MKTIFKLKYALILLIGMVFTSCETTDLDLLDDPNNIEVNSADMDRYLNSIQLSFASFVRRSGNFGSELTRIDYMFGRNYNNNYAPSSLDLLWRTAYSMFNNMKAAEATALEINSMRHVAVIKILRAYTLMTLVDYFGDIPYSQAVNPEVYPFPALDAGSDVYEAAITMLDEAIAILEEDPTVELLNDFYFDNDNAAWIKAANTMKMSAYLNTRLVDNTAMAKFNAIVDSGDFISSTADDMVFRYGANVDSPDTRHPAYNTDYAPGGADSYRSNWLMNAMLERNDPRMRYYFYRQNACTPGNVDLNGDECEANQQELPCSVQTRPAHYPADMAFCSLPDGYWGRDHGNADGIPPDGNLRTVIGVYPAGGKFDSSTDPGNSDHFVGVNIGHGGGGAGILPILLSSWSHFMIAEARMVENNDVAAATHLQTAVELGVNKVIGFGSVDPDYDASLEPSATDVTNFVTAIVDDFNNGTMDDKWDILAIQKFIAHYGNGIMAYDFYRRTGYPLSLQFNVEPNPGGFIRSFFYPAVEANTNSNVVQKGDVGVKVFWDNNPDSPAFPFAN